MKRGNLRVIVVLGSLAALVVGGCATGTGTTKAEPTQAVEQRQRLMKLHGALWKDIQDKAKAGNIEGIEPSAEALALNASRIPSLFPEGSITEKSKAKPEIWQKWPEFQAAAKNLETQSERLRDASKAKNTEQTQALVRDFGRQACGTCHTPFRVPPRT
ncbi:MAG TPA: cytochrome c [Methylomirabilota bacterium]|jgi:cytochrome c556|nr:cytochrome c [Methylomirabilota bacterium]